MGGTAGARVPRSGDSGRGRLGQTQEMIERFRIFTLRNPLGSVEIRKIVGSGHFHSHHLPPRPALDSMPSLPSLPGAGALHSITYEQCWVMRKRWGAHRM